MAVVALRRPTAIAMLACSAVASACASSGPRDVVPESHDSRLPASGGGAGGAAGSADGGAAGGGDTYAYVARRPHGVVALAEARNMSAETGRVLVDRIADDLERCAARLDADGTLVEGAARIVAVAGGDGTPGLNVRLAPGGAVAQNALLCLVAPIRSAALPPATKPGAAPGIAIEATWGPRGGARPTPEPAP